MVLDCGIPCPCPTPSMLFPKSTRLVTRGACSGRSGPPPGATDHSAGNNNKRAWGKSGPKGPLAPIQLPFPHRPVCFLKPCQGHFCAPNPAPTTPSGKDTPLSPTFQVWCRKVNGWRESWTTASLLQEVIALQAFWAGGGGASDAHREDKAPVREVAVQGGSRVKLPLPPALPRDMPDHSQLGHPGLSGRP